MTTQREPAPDPGRRGRPASRPFAATDAAGMLRAAAEALSVLKDRSPAEQREASLFAVELLIGEVEPADWASAGLAVPGRAPPPGERPVVPLRHKAALHLARAAMQLQCETLRLAQVPARWARLAEFFARRVPADDPQLGRLREHALRACADAGDVSPQVLEGLYTALERHIDTDGPDAYATGLARANLAVAYRERGTGTDLAEAFALTNHEVRARIERYGPSHPVTLVARSLLIRSLLSQAEATADEEARLDLARRALEETEAVRSARDNLYGVTSTKATRSRRSEGHALLLLHQLERAMACLEYALAFETARNDGREWHGSGPTHLLLARVHAEAGDQRAALDHARRAHELLSQDSPAGPECRAAGALLQRLGEPVRPVPKDARRPPASH